MKIKLWLLGVFCMVTISALPLRAQQKGQYVPGQFGLNAGILPSPGFSYVNMNINYSTDRLNDPNGNAVPGNAHLNIWALENIFYYVPSTKFLGGNIGFAIIVPTLANGFLPLDTLGISGTTWGLADTWVQPFTVGWHLKRADIQVGEAFMMPTGRYSPGARNNIGSGYFGNHFITGTTVYLTKNKDTSVNLFTDWETHGQRQGTLNTYKPPGQAFTDEWGLGQILPLKKDFSKLLQLGVIGYDQWQVTSNSGTGVLLGSILVPAKSLPFYSVHAVGGQATFIMPAKNLSFWFKL